MLLLQSVRGVAMLLLIRQAHLEPSFLLHNFPLTGLRVVKAAATAPNCSYQRVVITWRLLIPPCSVLSPAAAPVSSE
jgi:hypothetical protein